MISLKLVERIKCSDFFNIVVYCPAVADCQDHRFQIVVLEHHVGDFPRHVGAAMAHGDSDVRGLERRSVVYAVPGHRNYLPGILEGLDYLELMGGADPGKYVHPLRKRSERPRIDVGKAGRIKDFYWLFTG